MKATSEPYIVPNFNTPIALIVFNRPEKTRRAFEIIRQIRPRHILIIADGPRNDADQEKCQQVRRIVSKIDWDCQVEKKFSPINLGCKINISSGLDWVFTQVEKAIILEDDCLPDHSFFRFCEELLEKYRNDERIMQISGYTFAIRDKNFQCKDSYYFSDVGSINGWASWRRAWQYYDVNVTSWPRLKQSGMLLKKMGDPAVVNHYNNLFDQYYNKTIDSWDSQWYLTRWVQNGLSIQSKTNLVINIGFDDEATHNAIDPNDSRAHVPLVPMTFPLQHPTNFTVNGRADAYVLRYCLGINKLFGQRIRWFIKYRLPWLYSLLKKI